jgi:hypothetical protein
MFELQLQILEPGLTTGRKSADMGGLEAYILERSLDLATETDPDDPANDK